MNNLMSSYYKLTAVALIITALLVFIQFSWIQSANTMQQELVLSQLQNAVPQIALEVNSIDHRRFHGTKLRINKDTLELVEDVVNRMSIEMGLGDEVFFALYQDTIGGLFYTNYKGLKKELLQSKIRSCITCINSFSISKGGIRKENESVDLFEKRVLKESTFQYFSPVTNGKQIDGETLWFSLYQEPQVDAATKNLRVGFYTSIILLLCLLALFYYLLRALSLTKRSNKMKGDFFNNMTHEFKTPLSSIRLASRVLRTSTDERKNITYLDLIEKESQLLEKQIDGLLTLSLLDNNKIELMKEAVDLHELIEAVPKRLKVLIEEKNASVTLTLDSTNATIIGDATHLSNSLCNLVENSLKYSSTQISIYLSTIDEDGKCVIKIRDNGPGIAAEFRKDIFTRFYRGKKRNQYKGQGFGIGLSYVKSIIESHGGHIVLNEGYTDGCEFIIKF